MGTSNEGNKKITGLRNILRELESRRHPYAVKMEQAGIKADDIRSYEDMEFLPYTTKQDLLSGYPMGWLARNRDEIVRIHATSGTTGKPTVVAYTASDIKRWTDNVAWCLGLAGVTKSDVVQVAHGYGLFTGGLGVHYGAESIGATVIPTSGGFTDRQVSLMKDLGSTVLSCTPSYALRIAETIEKNGENKEDIHLRVGVFGAEAWSDELRESLEKRLRITALDLYGLSEAMGPGVGIECLQQQGLHISEDFLPEIISPNTLKRCGEGEMGELVLTSWNKEAFPVIRYRTRDLTELNTTLCACGSRAARIKRIRGRSDDMLIIHGVNIFPSQIEASLCKVTGLTANYQIETENKSGVQEMSITCERSLETGINDSDLERRAIKQLKMDVGITIPFKVLDPGILPRTEGKAVRVIRH